MPAMGAVDAGRTRRIDSGVRLDPALTMSALSRGRHDPVHRVLPDGRILRATRTPDGPATVEIRADPSRAGIEGRAWGPGAEWMLDRLAGLVGADDDPSGFEPAVPVLSRLARRFAGWRVARTGRVWEALLPAVLEQKVTCAEAWRSWRELVVRFGEPAPGPIAESAGGRLWVPPDAATIAALPVWEWHRAGVGPDRMRTLIRCARVVGRLEETIGLPVAEVERRLRVVPGIGPWTAAEVRQRAHGDADAVSVGDFHLPGQVGWALEGRRYDDRAMLTALERWRGHRYRVTRLIELAGIAPPRRGPRFAARDYRAI